MLEIATGNLLTSDADALVNSVNTVGVMGKGLALQFKRTFPQNFKDYAAACKADEVVIGRVFVHRTGMLQPRFILNVPTKRHWRQPSRLDDVRAGIQALFKTVRELEVRSVAVPPLGCGAGGLEWNHVRPLIVAEAEALPDVRVLLFDPAPSSTRRAAPTRTSRPQMTPGRAAVLALAEGYLNAGLDDQLSTLEVQKLCYFMQQAGEPLKLRFAKHHYGPYADNLRHVLTLLEGHYIGGLGDDSASPSARFELLEGSGKQASAFLSGKPETRAHIERVLEFVRGFEDAYGLELLATTHFVMRELGEQAGSAEAVVAGVHAWSERKARSMKPAHIEAAWERVRESSFA